MQEQSSPRHPAPKIELLPPKLRDLFFEEVDGLAAYIPSDNKVAYGGRGSAKSWGFARLAIVLGVQMQVHVLCVRELQNSIRESIHKLISEQIHGMGLSQFYTIQEKEIFGNTVNSDGKRTEFVFAGIKSDPGKIKSMEGIDICLVEEAEAVSEASWVKLEPTIRDAGAEMWIVFNPRNPEDATYKRYVLRTPPSTRRVLINWSDNPWFPKRLENQRQYALSLIAQAADDDERAQAQADYDHIWEGCPQKRSDASVLRRRVLIESFEPPDEQTRFHFGADWGFANDPTALVRFWITEDAERRQELWIDHEAFGYRVEIDETPQLFDSIPGARQWPIKADCARPETISYMRRQGFNIDAAEKWPGSLEDGIAHLKAFHRIHIHTRCTHLQQEARLYSYKIDRVTQEVLPIIVDANNHGIDAIRYGLDGYIQRRGVAGQWARLAE